MKVFTVGPQLMIYVTCIKIDFQFEEAYFELLKIKLHWKNLISKIF